MALEKNENFLNLPTKMIERLLLRHSLMKMLWKMREERRCRKLILILMGFIALIATRKYQLTA